MKHFEHVTELRCWLAEQRRVGRRVALVPTMGALHEGHLQLIKQAAAAAEVVVVSVFVNPLQFGEASDLARYPHTLDADIELATAGGATAVFSPAVPEIYPDGDGIRVLGGPSAERWEGAHRPGHFDGVLTVVAKLFNIVSPDQAFFGQKDIQQLALVKAMVAGLHLDIEIVAVPIVRDEDGLALSSRNRFLDPAQRRSALAVPLALEAARARWLSGVRSATELRAAAEEVLALESGLVVEYIAIAEPGAMAPIPLATDGTVVAVAVRVGTTRLIDNLILNENEI